MNALIETQELTKRFGPITAVEGVSFAVNRGEVLGFLGPNAAGKTTTMRMLTGYLPPSEGAARVCGFDVVTRPIEVKRRIGYLPEGAPAYGDMTPNGLLRFVAELHGLGGVERDQVIGNAIERLELGSVLHQPIETLSKGFKRRVGLAQAIMLDPDVLILDEPTDGLDPNQKHQVRALLREMAGTKAIVISTHLLEEVEAICTRAIIIAGGRIVADATPDELQARSHQHNAVGLRLPVEQAPDATSVLERLSVVSKVELVEKTDNTARLRALPSDSSDILGAVHEAVSREGVTVNEIFTERGRLDEVFRQLTMTSPAR